MYHLTDAPSFITSSEEIGETLCIFDPHAKFVPGVSKEEPGRRYNNVAELKNVFKDVFPCYLTDRFDIKNATMFRFPLRNTSMAKESELCEQSITSSDVEDLFSKFRQEILDCLLFLNNVTQISMSSIDKLTHRFSTSYSVQIDINNENIRERQLFHDHVKTISTAVEKGEIHISEIEKHQVQYILTLRDNKNYWERWLVVQQLGFDEMCSMSDSLMTAIKHGDISLLPRGGVATLIDKSDTIASKRSSRAFCFLPLPIRTGLPIHINGHFVLDHEARRNLWQEEEGYRSEWNNLLIKEVISQCYVSLLKAMPNHVFTDEEYVISSNYNLKIERYSQLFPQELNSYDYYWKNLITSVCEIIFKRSEPVFPVVKADSIKQEHTESEKYNRSLRIHWVAMGENIETYFDDLDTQLDSEENSICNISFLNSSRLFYRSTPKNKNRADILRHVLIESGFQLVRLPVSVFQLFTSAGVDVKCISPMSVLQFYKSNFISLPVNLIDSPMKTLPNFLVLFDYCIRDRNNVIDNLNDLPLLLCEDMTIRMFSANSPVYLSQFCELLPSCSRMFVHRAITERLFDIEPEDNPVFQRFDVYEFSNLLSNVLPEDFYCGSQSHVPWISNSEDLPNGKWIQLVWQFICSEAQRMHEAECDGINIDSEEELQKTIDFHKILDPLSEWCLLPAHIPYRRAHKQSIGRTARLSINHSPETEDFLVPVGMSYTVLDFTHTGIMSYAARDVLRKIGVPELTWRLVDSATLVSPCSPVSKVSSPIVNVANTSVLSHSEFTHSLTSSLQDPLSVLKVLEFCIKTKPIGNNLSQDDCSVLLKYFNDCNEMWAKDIENSTTVLKDLPFFLTIHGVLIKLGTNTVYVLPSDIPTSDMHIWEKESGIIFLRRNKGLATLYTILGCIALSTTDMYCKFIFDSFHLMSSEARLTHLTFLKDIKLHQLDVEENSKLLAGLERLPFIEDFTSILRTANCYYDPCHPVFKAMFSNELSVFPPEPFNTYKWLEFLRQVGMKHIVSSEMLVSFANIISEEAETNPTEATFNKSRTLIAHIFRRPDILDCSYLDMMVNIPFIPSVRITAALQSICPQYGFSTATNEVVYIPFTEAIPEEYEYLVWSSANLLPDWSNPLKLGTADIHVQKSTGDGDVATDEQILEHANFFKEELCKKLNIQLEPAIDMIIFHIKNISSSYKATCTSTDDLKAFMTVDVMKVIYKYLQNSTYDSDYLYNNLSKVAHIVVDNGLNLVRPFQVVINLYDDEQITPYLYKLPTELDE